MHRLATVALVLMGGCSLSLASGGAYSVKSSPDPRPGGFHARALASAGWGARYGNLSAVAGVSRVAKRAVYTAGAEIAVAFRPWTKTDTRADVDDTRFSEGVGGPALLGRVLYSGAGGVRITELAIGPGAGTIWRKHGPGNIALYATTALMTDERGRSGWSHGIEVSITMPVTILFGDMFKDFSRW